MTGRFVLYLGFLGLLYLTLNYTGYDFLMIFWFFLLLLPVFSLLSALAARHLLLVRPSLKQPQVLRGEEVFLYIEARNPTILPLPLISLELSHMELSSAAETRRIRMRLGGFEKETFALSYSFPHRGLYRLGIIRGHLRDACGFFVLPLQGSALSQHIALEVWPRPDTLPQGAASAASDIDAEISRSRRVSQELDQVARLRTYQPGDKLKLVHWSVSAHMQDLQVREFEDPRDLEAALILTDSLPAGPFGPLLADAGGEAALGLVRRITDRGMAVRLLLARMPASQAESASTLIENSSDVPAGAAALARQLPERLPQPPPSLAERLLLVPARQPADAAQGIFPGELPGDRPGVLPDDNPGARQSPRSSSERPVRTGSRNSDRLDSSDPLIQDVRINAPAGNSQPDPSSPYTPPELEALLRINLPRGASILYIVCYTIDEVLLQLLGRFRREQRRVTLFLLSMKPDVEIERSQEQLSSLQVKIHVLDPKRFAISDETDSPLTKDGASHV